MTIPTEKRLKRMRTRELEILADNDDLPEPVHNLIRLIIDRRNSDQYMLASTYGTDGTDYDQAVIYAEMN